MCIVVDTNTLASVFDEKSANHAEFKPVFDWIKNGKGKIVYGGTKYISELAKTKYLALFTEYNRAKKAILVKGDIDEEAIAVSAMIQHPDFDDQHLVALLRVSGCKLICSLDGRAYPYFRHSLFFNPAGKKPKIYSGIRNKDLLNDRNIAEVCESKMRTTNEQRKMLQLQ
jgi:predicted nucleic acid-binding protein